MAEQKSDSLAIRPIRVLCLIKGLGRGGAESLLLAQMANRDNQSVNYRVVHLTPEKRALVAEFESEGIEVTCLGARGSRDVRWLRRFRRLVVEAEIDVVHAHSPVAAAGARVALCTIPRRRRPKMVTTEHNVWGTHVRATRWADALTAPLDDAHIAVSAAVRASLPRRLHATTDVLHHGIDVAGVAAQRANRDAVRQELGVADDLVVGTVANLRVTKGWPDLLEAARTVADQVPGVRFIGVGQGPMEDEIARLHSTLRLGDRFQLLGYRADAIRVMAGCDVFCLASHDEGLPVVLMEAMALGLPIVATDVGGVSELVKDPTHGRLVPPHRPDLVASALIELLTDHTRRATASAAVRASALESSASDAFGQLEAIYARMVRS